VFEDDSYAIDLTLAVPIFVLVLVAEEVKLMLAFGTQCKSTVSNELIGKVPNWSFV
jgi:hypothetical protein